MTSFQTDNDRRRNVAVTPTALCVCKVETLQSILFCFVPFSPRLIFFSLTVTVTVTTTLTPRCPFHSAANGRSRILPSPLSFSYVYYIMNFLYLYRHGLTQLDGHMWITISSKLLFQCF